MGGPAFWAVSGGHGGFRERAWVVRRAGRGSTLGSRGPEERLVEARLTSRGSRASVLTERAANFYFFPSYFAEVFAYI